MKASTLQAKLIEKFNLEHCRTSEEFDGSIGGLWLSGEEYINDLYDIYNPYWFDVDPTEQTWIMGVYKPLHDFLQANGYFAEPYDSGTLLVYPE